jgi:hypothetical protein
MGDVKNNRAAGDSPRKKVPDAVRLAQKLMLSLYTQRVGRAKRHLADLERQELDRFGEPPFGTQTSLVEAETGIVVDESKARLVADPKLLVVEVAGISVKVGAVLRSLGVARQARLQRPPGYGLIWFADFFYSKKSVEECLRPTIQDLQAEYAEALAANRPHKARWVRIRGTWSFVCAAGMLTMASAGKQMVKIWKAVG